MSIINTHGYELEVNEHAGEKRVYTDITPRIEQSEIVAALKNQAGLEYKSRCTEHFAWRAADHIIKLEDEIKFLKKLINKYHLDNDPFTRIGR